MLEWAETTARIPSVRVEQLTSFNPPDIQSALFYAVYTDKPGPDTPTTDPKDYQFAGVMGQISSSVPDMTAEPGFIMIDTPYQVG